MSLTLDRMIDDRVLGPMHIAFGRLMQRIDSTDSTDVCLAAAVLSEQLARGHVCLELKRVDRIVFPVENEHNQFLRYEDWPELARWLEQLDDSEVVEVRDAGDAAELLQKPLVLDREHGYLYLARYWYYQQRLAHDIASRIGNASMVLNEDRLADDIRALFPDRDQPGGRDQCLAAANAVDQRFSVITGGPGTGKTTTVAKLLALQLLHHVESSDAEGNLRVVLVAPTGKAAQRLNHSLGRVTQQLQVSDTLRDRLRLVKAGTIHRMLGWTPLPPERGGPFTHGADFPIEADVVLVDEASMVDLGLMWRLLDAVAPEAQVILMGDRDQLASVEAGGVLADLCADTNFLKISGMSGERIELLGRRTGLQLPGHRNGVRPVLSDHVFNLQHSHRFDPSGNLGRLAECVRTGDADSVVKLLRSADGDLIEWIQEDGASALLERVVNMSAQAYAECLEPLIGGSGQQPLDLIQSLNQFRILCAHRSGRFGAANINRRVADRLQTEGVVRLTSSLYPGCPIMITGNDYQQGLFNGDVGVMFQSPGRGELSGLFEDASAEDGHRLVPESLLPTRRPCYTMTIHKSQGSEFHRVMVVLPTRPSPILTRELLYTAITRVADLADRDTGKCRPGQLRLVGREDVIRTAVRNRIRRTGGLREALAARNGLGV